MNKLIFSLFSKHYWSFSTDSGMPLFKKNTFFYWFIYRKQVDLVSSLRIQDEGSFLYIPKLREKRGEIGEEEAYLLTTTSGQYCRRGRQQLSKPQLEIDPSAPTLDKVAVDSQGFPTTLTNGIREAKWI